MGAGDGVGVVVVGGVAPAVGTGSQPAVPPLVERLQACADQCRRDGADHTAKLLDEAAAALQAANTPKVPRFWRCDSHGPGKLNAWGCPDCVVELRRWKSTNAPRLDALQGLLQAAQVEAAAGREAVASLAGERAANALLTDEVERLRAAVGPNLEVSR